MSEKSLQDNEDPIHDIQYLFAPTCPKTTNEKKKITSSKGNKISWTGVAYIQQILALQNLKHKDQPLSSFMPEYNDYCNENGLIKTHLNKNVFLLILVV